MNDFEDLVHDIMREPEQKDAIQDLLFRLEEHCIATRIAKEIPFDHAAAEERRRAVADLSISIGLTYQDLQRLYSCIHEKVLQSFEVKAKVDDYPFIEPLMEAQEALLDVFHSYFSATTDTTEIIAPLHTVYMELQHGSTIHEAISWMRKEATEQTYKGNSQLATLQPAFLLDFRTEGMRDTRAATLAKDLREMRTICSLLVDNRQKYRGLDHYKALALIDRYLGFLWHVEGYVLSLGKITPPSC